MMTSFVLVFKIFRTIRSDNLYLSVSNSATLVSWLSYVCLRTVFLFDLISGLNYSRRSSNLKWFFSARLPWNPDPTYLFVRGMMKAFDFCYLWWFCRDNYIGWSLIRTRWLDWLIILIIGETFHNMLTMSLVLLRRTCVFGLHI